PGGVEHVGHPGRESDRSVAQAICLERRQRQLGRLPTPAPARPVEGERHRLPPLGPTFEDRADRHLDSMLAPDWTGGGDFSVMLLTTIAGSLPKPAWLAKPEMLWAPWLLPPELLAGGQRDAVLAAL